MPNGYVPKKWSIWAIALLVGLRTIGSATQAKSWREDSANGHIWIFLLLPPLCSVVPKYRPPGLDIQGDFEWTCFDLIEICFLRFYRNWSGRWNSSVWGSDFRAATSLSLTTYRLKRWWFQKFRSSRKMLFTRPVRPCLEAYTLVVVLLAVHCALSDVHKLHALDWWAQKSSRATSKSLRYVHDSFISCAGIAHRGLALRGY